MSRSEVPNPTKTSSTASRTCDTLFVTGKQLDKIYDLQHQLETLITLDNAQDPLGLLSPLAFDDFLQEGYGLLKSGNQDPFPDPTRRSPCRSTCGGRATTSP